VKVKWIPLASILLLSFTALAQEVPKVDLFFGYSFLRANQAQSVPAFTANGGLFNVGFNFNNHIALEAEFGGYHNGNVSGKEFDTTSFSYLFGPRFSLGRSRKVDPYFHVLFGVNRAATSVAADSVLIPTPQSATPSSNGRFEASQANFAMAAGGGLDIKLSRHVVLRPIQLDYYLTRFQTPDVLVPTGGTSENRNQHDLRFAAGIAFNIGGEKTTPPPPPPPPAPTPAVAMKTCPGGRSIPASEECPKSNIGLGINVTPNAVCPGASAHVSTTANLPDGANIKWTVGGEPISQSPSFEFGATGRQPGSYRIGLAVAAEGYNDASAETTVTVQDYVPPSGSVSASPAEIFAGDAATLDASFRSGQCGGALGPTTFTASEGSIRGNRFDSSGIRFDPPGASEQRKTITVTARVNDESGSGSAEGTVIVKQRAALAAQRLPDIAFQQGSNRVNNCGKRVLLEDLKNRFDADPGGRVVFVGHIAQSEAASMELDLKRALNSAAVISAGQGVCTQFPASQILVKGAGAADNGVDFQPYFCGASAATAGRPGQQPSEEAKYRRVEVWFVPSGGMLPASASDAKEATTLGVSRLGCPR